MLDRYPVVHDASVRAPPEVRTLELESAGVNRSSETSIPLLKSTNHLLRTYVLRYVLRRRGYGTLRATLPADQKERQ